MKITGQPNPRCPNGSSQGGSWILWLLHPPGVLTVLWKLDTRPRRASLQILFCFLAFVNMSDYTVHPTARNFPPKLGLGGGGCLQLFIVRRGESSQDMGSLPPLCHFCRLQVASPRFLRGRWTQANSRTRRRPTSCGKYLVGRKGKARDRL